MKIQFNTDNNITGGVKLHEKFSAIISNYLSKYRELITRVEVHLGDKNSHKGGVNDKRCVLEARLEGLQPIVVTNHDDTVEQSVKGALDKLKAAIDSTRGRLRDY